MVPATGGFPSVSFSTIGGASGRHPLPSFPDGALHGRKNAADMTVPIAQKPGRHGDMLGIYRMWPLVWVQPSGMEVAVPVRMAEFFCSH